MQIRGLSAAESNKQNSATEQVQVSSLSACFFTFETKTYIRKCIHNINHDAHVG